MRQSRSSSSVRGGVRRPRSGRPWGSRSRLLPGRGIRRSMSPGAVWANVGAVLGLVWATLRSLASFVRRRPRVVVVVGGYASFPAGLAAVVRAGPAGPGQHRCGARSRQCPPRTIRRGERRGVSRHGPSTGPGHRHARAPRTGIARPLAGGSTSSEGHARAPRRTAHAGRLRRLPGRPADQRRGRRPGLSAGRIVLTSRSITWPADGISPGSLRGPDGATSAATSAARSPTTRSRGARSPGCIIEWCPSRRGCPRSTVPPTSVSAGPAP